MVRTVQTCRKCGENKSFDAFYRVRRNEDKRHTQCKDCMRPANVAAARRWNEAHPGRRAAATKRWNESNRELAKERRRRWNEDNPDAYRERVLTRYGLTLEDYRRLNESGPFGPGLCWMCGTDTPGRGDKNLHIDHDHSTGRVRGLLCLNCNREVGIYEKSRVRAEAYLRAAQQDG
jgi:hypothetical protein